MLEFFLILICLCINAVLAGSETAFIALNKQTLKILTKKGDKKAKLLLQLRENPERTLSIVQIGITFVGAFAAALGGAGAEESIAPYLVDNFYLSESFAEILSIFLIVIPLTYASVVLGELVPKTLALRRSMTIASFTAPWIHLISRLIHPIVTSFEWSTKKIISLFPKEHTSSEESENESITLEEVVTPLNKQYIMNMVKIETTRVEEIYVDWAQVTYVNDDDTMQDVEKIIVSSGHTRLPIVRGEQVIGILNSKEFLAFQKTGKENWLSLLRPTLFIHEKTHILTALRYLQKKRTHMGIIYNNQQKIGIVTMEAIFEEIIGDIYDEDDDGAIAKILRNRY
jgi:putative hemolysin